MYKLTYRIFSTLGLPRMYSSFFLLLFKIERQLQFRSRFLLQGFRDEEGFEAFGMEFVDAHDGIGIAIGEFVTRDEILGFLHHHTHLLQVIGGDAIESSGIDDEHSRLHSDAWHTQNPLVVVTIDVHGKLFWM